MKTLKCPRCGKELSQEEFNDRMCYKCACLMKYDKKKDEMKKRNFLTRDIRKHDYRFWINFFRFVLFVLVIIAIYSIIKTFRHTDAHWAWFITGEILVLYGFLTILDLFIINTIRDRYLIIRRLEQLEKEKNKEKIEE